MQKLSLRLTATFIFALPLISACVSNSEPELQLSERFQHRVTEQGRTEYAFGLVWYIEGQEPRRDENRGQPGQIRNGQGQRPPRSGSSYDMPVRVDNEDKIRLEDEAVSMLEARLKRDNLCPDGHEIEQVIWGSNRLRLMGYCK